MATEIIGIFQSAFKKDRFFHQKKNPAQWQGFSN